MKKTIFLLFVFFLAVSYAAAYQLEVKVLNEEAITALSDKELTNAYIDTVVELEASKAFYTTSGFMPEEYKDYKGVVRYRILLLNELTRRKLEVPKTE
ncbi:MAG: hypothetical protein WC676_03445 [Candidatus Omnitrophota bacterium]